MTKYCPSCGEELIDSAKFCKNCGCNLDNMSGPINSHQQNTQQFMEASEKSHTFAIVAGYVLAIFIPLFGLIAAIYLMTRDSPNAKKHGKYVLIVTVAIWVLSMIAAFR